MKKETEIENEKNQKKPGDKEMEPAEFKEISPESEEEEKEDDEDEDDDDEEEDDERESRGVLKTVLGVIAAVALVAVGATFGAKYMSVGQRQNQGEAQTEKEVSGTVEQMTEEKMQETDTEQQPGEAAETELPTPTPELTSTPIPTSTPKPLPTATPTPIPASTFETDATVEPLPNGDDTASYDMNAAVEEESAAQTEAPSVQAAHVILMGDSRFRELANNVQSDGEISWQCSSSGDFSWLTGTAYQDCENYIGEGTQVFINIGLNDLYQYSAYATSINAKAAEWEAKGATVYFVSVGPVDATSSISNQDIANFNTYMYQNLTIPFIDMYNYLVQSGFATVDGQTYDSATNLAIYNYLNGFMH